MAHNSYQQQVQLLVQCLPFVAKEEAFALKGGTAINLFYRDLPRLSVDIDLTFLPIKSREDSLHDVSDALGRIEADVLGSLPNLQAKRIAGGGNADTRLLISGNGAEVKIETSPVLRGVVNEPELKVVSEAVEDTFGFAEMKVVAFEDLFAGKLCAALDRQHPRDLYDVKLLYENEGISVDLMRTFFVYVASAKRPFHEILAPNAMDIRQAYSREFEGMTFKPVTLEELLQTRERLFADIRARLDERARQFFLSLHNGEPDFAIIDHDEALQLPAVQWKIVNLEQLAQRNPEKHEQQRKALEALF